MQKVLEAKKKETAMNAEFEGSKFFLMIPTKVSRDPELLKKPKAIILFGEIYTMLNATGKFYMSNGPLCERLDCKKTALKGYLNLLEERGYIKRQVVYSDDTQKKIIGRYITVGPALGRGNDLPSVAETTYPRSQERPTLGRGNDHKDINLIDQENISKETPTGGRSKREKRESKVYTEILDYLNEKTERTGRSKFRDCPANRSLIDGLLDMKPSDRYYSGRPYTIEDFKEVIDKKVTEWKGTGITFSSGKLAEDFLQPSTLFAKGNFYKYLMQKTSRTSAADNGDRPEYQNLFANQWHPQNDDDLPF